MFYYSNSERENNPIALPDLEVFQDENGDWYWNSCFAGCVPDGDLFGPFETEQEALEDAREFGGNRE